MKVKIKALELQSEIILNIIQDYSLKLCRVSHEYAYHFIVPLK